MTVTPRTRSYDTRPGVSPAFSSSAHLLQYVKGGSNFYVTKPDSLTGAYAYTYDFVTPDYKSVVSKGGIVNNPYYTEQYEAIRTLKTSSGYWPDTWGDANGWVYGFSTPDPLGLRFGPCNIDVSKFPTTEDATIIGRVVTAAYAGVASPDAMALVSLGEASETLALLREPLDLLVGRTRPFRDAIVSFNRGKHKDPRFLIEKFSNLWLKYRYGIMPLMYDLDGWLKALSSVDLPVRQTSRGREVTSGTSTSFSIATAGTLDNCRLDVATQWSQEYRAGVLYETIADLQSRLGLRLSDVPEAVWELTRFSFVADWFVNAGDFIGALTSSAKATHLAAWSTVKTTATQSFTYTEGTPKTAVHPTGSYPNRTFVITNSGTGAQVVWRYKRTVRQPVTLANIVLAPQYKLNTKRYVDAFALLSNSFRIPRK